MHKEKHTLSGKYIKPIVYGGVDGIITTFAIVSSSIGAGLDQKIILIMGVGNLVADAFSMGMGNYISNKSEYDYIKQERDRELDEVNTVLDKEKKEMTDIYEEKGFTAEDASIIINIMTKPEHKDFFVDHMMIQELELMPLDTYNNFIFDALITLLSFMFFGSIPLFAFILFDELLNNNAAFGIACLITSITLFLLGSLQSKFSNKPWYISGLFVTGNGIIACSIAYLIGYGLDKL